jgi:lysine 2,3-aminomutase
MEDISNDDKEKPPEPTVLWQKEFKNRLTTKNQIEKFINLTNDEIKGFENTNFSISITPHILSLINSNDPNCPIRKQFIPTYHESNVCSTEMDDPCGEDKDLKTPILVHRYPDRVLFLVSNVCASYCRHCTRSRRVGTDHNPTEKDFNDSIEYIKKHTCIRDVLLSGGDPLLLSDEKLEFIIKTLRNIPHVEIIRIGTRVPIVLPSRITQELCDMLEKYHPLFMSIHINHPKELTEETKIAFHRLSKAAIPLGSQTVLLKNINDNIETMRELVHKLLQFRIKPYYVYQCDLVKGSSHFRTTVQTGIDIIKQLRGFTSGYAIPTFVIDAPGGGGKVPVESNNVLYHDENIIEIKNWQNKIYTYPEKDNLELL